VIPAKYAYSKIGDGELIRRTVIPTKTKRDKEVKRWTEKFFIGF
jgi:hypothetical protein